jgi:hypothetical protein
MRKAPVTEKLAASKADLPARQLSETVPSTSATPTPVDRNPGKAAIEIHSNASE